ncbi:MAG: (d)CMP kinase [Elusimicrobia bacterium]|nr:(d)CMP kinase [Elusimicrobiota bacterium]
MNPLKQAPDALVIDSTRLTMHQVADKILRRIRNGAKANGRGR